MAGPVTKAQFQESLCDAGVRFAQLPLEAGHSIIVTEHWGKLFGPFGRDDEPGTLWISPKAVEPAQVQKMVEGRDWCIGGDRIWLAPEVQFNIPDRQHSDSGGAYTLPKAVDPGEYCLEKLANNAVSLEQTVSLQLYNLATGLKKVRIRRTVRPARDPLRTYRGYSAVSGKVVFTGYSQEIELKDLADDPASVEVWNLAQFNPGVPWLSL